MALTRKFLAALGIEPDKVDEIISAHVETVDALKNERDAMKVDYNIVNTLEQQLESANAAIAAAAADDYKGKYEAAINEFNAYKTDIANKEARQAKENAYRSLLRNAGVSENRVDTVLKVTDIDSLEFSDGAYTNAEAITEGIKSEWADFISTTVVQGADVAAPPANNGNTAFENMTLTEKMTYANAHPTDSAVASWLTK